MNRRQAKKNARYGGISERREKAWSRFPIGSPRWNGRMAKLYGITVTLDASAGRVIRMSEAALVTA